MPAGPATIQATKSGYATGTAPSVTVLYAQTTTAPAIALTVDATTTATIASKALLVGATSHGGTTVTLSGSVTRTTTTTTDGSYAFGGLTGGIYSLSFANGPYRDAIPSVLAQPGGNGFIIDALLYPLAPITLQRGARVAQMVANGYLEASADASGIVATDVTWSGTATAYTLINTATGLSTPLNTARNSGLVFTPDGSHVFFADATNELSTIATTATTPVTLGSFAGNAVASRDGRTMVYGAPGRTWGTLDLHTSPIGGGAPTIVPVGVSYANVLDLSPDGTKAAYMFKASEASNDYSLAVANLLSARSTVLTKTFISGGLFTPDGASIVYQDQSANLRLAAADGSSDNLLVANVRNYYSLSASPTRDKVAVVTSSGLVLVAFPSGTKTTVGGAQAGPLGFSPDGAALLYLDASPGTVGTHVLFFGSGQDVTLSDTVYRASIYSGGSSVFVLKSVSNAGTDTILYAVREANGAVSTVASHLSGLPLVSPDGTMIAYVDEVQNRAGRLRTASTAGGASTTIATNVAIDQFAFSHDSKRLAFLVDPSTYPPGLLDNGTLKFALAAGGPATTCADRARTPAWGTKGTLFASRNGLPPFTLQNAIYEFPVP